MRFTILLLCGIYCFKLYADPYKGRRWLNRLTVLAILLLLMILPVAYDGSNI